MHCIWRADGVARHTRVEAGHALRVDIMHWRPQYALLLLFLLLGANAVAAFAATAAAATAATAAAKVSRAFKLTYTNVSTQIQQQQAYKNKIKYNRFL